MEWSTKTPEHCAKIWPPVDPILAMDAASRGLPDVEQSGWCAESTRGEFAVINHDGKFAIYLNGLLMVAPKYDDVGNAMKRAEELDQQLSSA